jgi:membrane protein YdbS with pleckstrin-like domain/rubredoxin
VARFSPIQDQVPASVNKYLLPGESHVINVRQHPAVMLGRALLVLAGFVIAFWITIQFSHGNTVALWVIWGLWGVGLLWLGAKVWGWAVYYFVITSKRILLAQGVLLRKVNFIPLDKVTDVEFRRSQSGRLLGYGELEVMTPGQDLALRHIRFLPYPEQIYLEVCGMIFRDTDRPPDTGRCPECAMEIPAAARLCPYCRTPQV